MGTEDRQEHPKELNEERHRRHQKEESIRFELKKGRTRRDPEERGQAIRTGIPLIS